MRGGLLLVVTLALSIAAAPAAGQTAKQSERVPRLLSVKTQPIQSFSRSEPDRVRFGSLDFLGGLVLEADDKRFGGISGIRMLDDAGTFLAITDRGNWLRGRIVTEGQKPAGIEKLTIAPMLDTNRSTLSSGSSFDTEALALGSNGEVFVGIERVHRILRFDFGKLSFLAPGRTVETPRAMQALPRNQGIEGLVFVPPNRPLGGALIAFSELGLDRNGNIRAFIVGGPSPGEFSVRRSNDFAITDAALIPGGDIVILERYFSILRGLGMRMRLIRLSDIQPGATVDGKALIEASGAHEIDNMEGIAAHRTADGETILTVVSDDNFSGWLQRTILLRFHLRQED